MFTHRSARAGGGLLAALALTSSVVACATPLPLAPSFTALPKEGEDFTVFRDHDSGCRTYADGQSGLPSAEDHQDKQVASALLGAGLGAAAGAAIGSTDGRAGNGAAIGAGGGLLLGSALGGRQARRTQAVVQRRYDGAYAQCMIAQGERVPRPAPRAVAYAAPVLIAPAPPVVYAPAPYPPPPYAP